jgi:hypothetical protein
LENIRSRDGDDGNCSNAGSIGQPMTAMALSVTPSNATKSSAVLREIW